MCRIRSLPRNRVQHHLVARARWYDIAMVTSGRVAPRARPALAFNGVKVFCATMFAQREQLGETVTHWLAERPHLELVDLVVTQSSDAAFHCISISVFYFERLASPRNVK